MTRRIEDATLDVSAMTPDAIAAAERAGAAGVSRRGFLLGAGVLFVGFSSACAPGPHTTPTSKLGKEASPLDPPLDLVDSWIAIASDESITAYTGKCEFGQGFRTVQYQLIADELYVPIERITLIVCDTSMTPDQGITSGSQSHPAEFGPRGLRQALATAREALLALAAEHLEVTEGELTVDDGTISVAADPSRSVTYGALVGGKRFDLAVRADATPKDPSDYTVLGTSVPRYEIPAKVTGEFEMVHHVRVPGMLHGRVVRPPTVGAKVIRVDEGSVKGLPGNVRVVVKRDFVGVVADKQWQAIKAAAALKVTWSKGVVLPKQRDLYDTMRKQPSRDFYTVLATGDDDVDTALAGATTILRATYLHPYQLHGSLGTSCAVADVKGTTSATIWSATQGIYPQRDSVAKVLGMPKENIRVVFVEGSGCYGLNGADSVSYDAAILSQAVGEPVRVQLSRKDEMTGADSFGPAYVIDLRAGLDDDGDIVAWDYESWSLSKGSRPNAASPGNIFTGGLVGFPAPPVVPSKAPPPTKFNNNGNSAPAYGAGCVGGTCSGTGTVKSERVLVHTIASPFYTGPLRSPARLQNTFANESFVDELAAFVGADPVEYRLRFLSDPRLIDVLKAAAKAAKWDARPSPKPDAPTTGVVTGRGVACILYEGRNGYTAMVAEVSVDQKTGQITVTRLVASQDSGPISNPDGLRNQVEGGALQGMSRAMIEEVTWDDEKVLSVDWRTYPVLRFGVALPKVEAVLIDRPGEQQMGAGECAITLSAAAIGNAVFDATGARLRQVPFTPARVLAALAARDAAAAGGAKGGPAKA